MQLFKFVTHLRNSKHGVATIPAKELDGNFARLQPLKQDGNLRQYLLTETPEGWSIKVFPDFPSGSGPFFLAFANGTLYWTGSGVNEPENIQMQLVEVERCDGKKMKILGTGWV